MMKEIEEEIQEADNAIVEKEETDEKVLEQSFQKASQQLAKGLLSLYQPPLETVKKELDDLTSKQESLLAHMQIENKKIQDIQEDAELNEMFSKIATLREKLVNIKKNMFNIHERTVKLKKRTSQLKQFKDKESQKKEPM